MVSHHVAGDDRRLGVTLLPPGFERELLGGKDHRGAGDLPGAEATARRRLDIIVGIGAGQGLVDDVEGIEAEKRAGIDQYGHIHRIGQVDIGRQIGRFDAADADGGGAAVIAFIVERCDDAAIIAARLGQEARRARGRLVLVGKEGRGVAHGGLDRAGGIDRNGDDIGLRVGDDRLGVSVGLILEQADTKDLERGSGHGDHAEAGSSHTQCAKTRY